MGLRPLRRVARGGDVSKRKGVRERKRGAFFLLQISAVGEELVESGRKKIGAFRKKFSRSIDVK